jgi:asparagine synthase (glutamine-hydrolysing)
VSNLDFRRIEYGKNVLNRFTLNKFENDKIFIHTEEFIVVLEGVILNKKQLKPEDKSWYNCIVQLYKEGGNDFFKVFRGSFSGALFDKIANKWIIYTDHIGSKHLYYYRDRSNFFLSSEISGIYNVLKQNNISYKLSEQAAYMLLSYGYMLSDNTLCSSIKKILPGHYILIENGEFNIIEYYTLPVSLFVDNINEDKIIEELDQKFRKAISLQFEKDKEYGYKHLVALSGGLDSRMTSWVAHSMGYTDQLNFTFSQSNYLDETIPKKIATDLKHEWLFKALDNGLFLRDIEVINKITGGNVLYYGLAHGNSLLKYINFENFGIAHSGQLGDVVISSFLKNLNSLNRTDNHGAYSKKLLSKVREQLKDKSQVELSLIYQRGFNGANNGLLATQEYTETISPFYDIDFFEYCLGVPLNFRLNHNLYKKWILMKYPQAAKYIWESSKKKLTSKTIRINFKNKSIPVNKLIPLIMYKLRLTVSATNTKHHMNPLDYWYKTNPDIKQFQDQYFTQNIDRVIDSSLKIDCLSLYNSGTAIEKNQVLTLLSALKLFY